MKTVLIIVLLLVLAMVGAMFWAGSKSRSEAPTLGASNDQFVPCPDTPNCLSSDATDDAHRFAALALAADASWASIVAEVKQLPGVTVVEESAGYVRAEAKSSIFGFIDDLEVQQRGNQLAVRSASRVGKSDMGANLKRLTELESRLKAAGIVN
ncbi:MAG: DUF1499 domain-containing protein [Pseudomonadota bacterium]